MSTRQNKKRKGRGNVLNRERTVTTLTEGPEAPFLSVSPSDEAHLNLMSNPFPSATGAPPLAPAFSLPANFNAFSYSYMNPMSGPPYTPNQSLFGSQPLPPGQNDLEILERLKETIKNNQHEFFQPVPRPAALAQLYLGPRSVPPHPEQIPSGDDQRPGSLDPAGVDASAPLKGAGSKASGDSANGPDNSHKYDSNGLTGFKTVTDSPGKSMDIDPPGLNTPISAADPGVKFESDPVNAGMPRMGASSYSKYDGQALGRSATEKSLAGELPYTQRAQGDPSSGKLSSRDSTWATRDSGTAQDDPKARPDDRSGTNGRASGDQRFGAHDNGRWQRPYRDFDHERDRDRERDRDMDRDRDRDRRGLDRFSRDDRRSDSDRSRYDSRRPPPEQRRYEPRYDARNGTGEPPRRWESKTSVSTDSVASSRADERTIDARARPLGEERSFETRQPRPPAGERSFDSRPSLDDRAPLPPRPLEDRLEKPGSALADERPPLSRDRIANTRPIANADRRPPPPPPLSSEKLSKPATTDDRLHPNSPPVAGSDPGADRSARPPVSLDDRRQQPPSLSPTASRTSGVSSVLDRGVARVADDRRPAAGQRSSADDRRPPALQAGNERPRDDLSNARPTGVPPADAGPLRAPPPDRARPPPSEDRRPVPLEERISRPASLQERLSTRPGDQTALVKVEERVPRLGGPTEDRPAPPIDDRNTRPAPITSEDRLGRPPTTDAPAAPPRTNETRNGVNDSSRAPPPDRRPDDRGRPPVSDRFASGAAPAGDRTAAPPSRYNYNGNRPLSLVRDEPRPYKARGATVSPRRGDYRPPVDRPSFPDRYEAERPPRERRPDTMDVDPVGAPDRYNERAPGYRRPSPPPFARQDRAWPPPGEAYPQEGTRRVSGDSPAPAYARDWRDDERGYDDWDRARTWDRDRPPAPSSRERDYERDRDGRFVERDVPPPGWETREERDRRVSSGYPPPPAADVPPSRSFDSRPLSARLSDNYPPPPPPPPPALDDRDRAYDRARYPPPPPLDAGGAGTYSRVRARSPSPPRRAGIDDLRPPLKRARDDYAGGPGYYSPPALDAPRDYPPPPRGRTPPVGGYYDDVRAGYASPAGSVREREREFMERDGYGGYPHDRRDTLSINRMPPPRSPPPYARGGYDRRYPAPLPRP